MEIGLARLLLGVFKMDTPAVEAHGGARFHPGRPDAVARDALCEVGYGRFGTASARIHVAANVEESVEKCACGDYDTLGMELYAPNGAHAHARRSPRRPSP